MVCITNVGEITSKLEVIALNSEKYISFSYTHLRFLDRAAFLPASLETSAENLYEEGMGKHKFDHSIAHCKDPSKVDLLLKKGVYPYDYMNSWSKMDETSLSSKDDFYSKLNDEHISDEDYARAQTVWAEFGIQILGEYHDLYMTTDVLLLADIFENFRDICLRDYDLDPCHYFTPALQRYPGGLDLVKSSALDSYYSCMRGAAAFLCHHYLLRT